MKSQLIKMLLWILGDHQTAGRVKKYLGSIFLKHFPGQITCREFETFIIDYSEDSLPEHQRRLFDWHMVICPMCKIHFETYRQTIQLGQMSFDEDDSEVPADVPAELINAILVSRNR